MSDPGDRPTPPQGTPPTEHMPASPPPTTQMPAQSGPGEAFDPVTGAVIAGGAVPPPDDPYAPGVFDEPGDPWYRKPGPLTAAIIGGLLFLALLGFLLSQLLGGDGEEDVTVNRLLILTTDEAGAPVDRTFVAEVTGPPESPDEFLWLRPPNATAPEPATDSTGAEGRVEFAWGPSEAVTTPSAWVSDIVVTEEVPPEWTPPGPIIECVLERRDQSNSVVEVQVEVEGADPAAARTARYSFVDHDFQPGDTVNCTFSSVRPGGTTTTSSSTTSSSTTTSTTSTTSTTTTMTPPTTEAPTTPAPTEPPTTPTPTEPPTTLATTTTSIAPAADSLLAALSERPEDFSTFIGLAGVAGLSEELNEPGTLTLFVPVNSAFEAITIPGTPAEIRDLLEGHMIRTEVIGAADLTDGPLEMANGDELVVDVSLDPATIGGVPLIETDQPAAPGTPDAATNGVFHVVLDVLEP